MGNETELPTKNLSFMKIFTENNTFLTAGEVV